MHKNFLIFFLVILCFSGWTREFNLNNGTKTKITSYSINHLVKKPSFPILDTTLRVSFCIGANQAEIIAAPGYSAYNWYAPGNPPALIGTNSTLLLTNPVVGTTYTVQMVTYSGSTVTVSATLAYTTVGVSIVVSNSTCAGGASGTASVLANGSVTGYNYAWYGPSGPNAIGTTSALANLAAGIYTLGIDAIGAPSCGSAVATVTIGVSTPTDEVAVWPFCDKAYLSILISGSAYQWYNNTSSITAVQGGAASTYTVQTPAAGDIYRLAFTTQQGCRDSVSFLLTPTTPGTLTVSNNQPVCVGANNGSVALSLALPPGSAQGAYSFSVFSVPQPTYISAISGSSLTTYTATGLGAGNYSVTAFDRFCVTTTSFAVNAYQFNFQVSPLSSTICQGSSIIAGVSFTSPISVNQYSFNWSPPTFIVGGQINAVNSVIQVSPVIPSGTVITTIYSITVVPAIANCPLTKTISVTAANLQNPTITAIPPLCTNAPNYTVQVSPSGGIFSTSSGSWLSNTGIITPSLVSTGTHSFVYSVNAGTCSASTGTFSVSQFNSAALTTSAINVCTATPCFNLMNFVQNPNGIWAGIAIGFNNMFCPAFSATSVTAIYYNPSSPNPTACPDSKTLTINVLNLITPTITVAGPFCSSGPPVQLTASPATGTFTANSYITASGLLSPSLAAIGNNTVQYNFCSSQATQQISIEAFVPPTITGTVANQCNTNPPVSLQSITQYSTGSWMGPGVTGTAFNPALSGLGMVTLTYNTASIPSLLCPAQASIAVMVAGGPTLEFAGNTVICSGASAALTGVGASTYSWSTGAVVPSVTLSPAGTTVYTLTGANQYNCSSTLTVQLVVNPCTDLSELNFQESEIKIYPNPASDRLFIELQSSAYITLFDNLGRLVFKDEFERGRNIIELNYCSPGVYQLKYEQADKTGVLKIIKTNQ